MGGNNKYKNIQTTKNILYTSNIYIYIIITGCASAGEFINIFLYKLNDLIVYAVIQFHI